MVNGAVRVAMIVVVAVFVRALPSPCENRGADDDHEYAREQVDPGIERVRDDERRERQCHAAEREHTDRVRDRRYQPEERGVSWGAARANEICSDNRLPVPGRECVRRAPEERNAQGSQDNQEGEVAPADEAREAGGARSPASAP